jgi:hypothetical protein
LFGAAIGKSTPSIIVIARRCQGRCSQAIHNPIVTNISIAQASAESAKITGTALSHGSRLFKPFLHTIGRNPELMERLERRTIGRRLAVV